MRYYIVKELNNNLYAARLFASKNLKDAIFFEHFTNAQCYAKLQSFVFQCIKALGHNPEETIIAEFKKLEKSFNIKVIPIEIIEDCYIE